jgi:hypothetical protein
MHFKEGKIGKVIRKPHLYNMHNIQYISSFQYGNPLPVEHILLIMVVLVKLVITQNAGPIGLFRDLFSNTVPGRCEL